MGWVLLPALLLAQAAAYRQATGVVLAMDVAYGGAAGIGCAALLQVAIADGPLSLHWAFPGWMAGAAVVAGLLRVAPPTSDSATNWNRTSHAPGRSGVDYGL